MTSRAAPVSSKKRNGGALRHMLAAVVLLSVSAAAVGQQTGTRIDPAPSAVKDTANEPVVRRVTNQFARCVADTRPQWAEQILDLPFTSQEQLREVAKKIGGWDDCLATYQFDLKLSDVGLVGGMAESRILQRFKAADVRRFASVTDDQLFASPAAPRNTSEDFAMCLVRKNPRAVRALVESVPTTDKEAAAIKELVPHLSGCLVQGMSITLNWATVRAYAAYGLYRLHTKHLGAGHSERGRD